MKSWFYFQTNYISQMYQIKRYQRKIGYLTGKLWKTEIPL